ncbi:MAG: TIGR01459 family HAD-type hydrolase [Pseudomonadota bacterium]
MTQMIDRLADIADRFDAIVFDQWGVLHDGTTPYSGVPDAVAALADSGKALAVLSNSGKRAAPNAERIAAKGYPTSFFRVIMTSGEALWLDLLEDGGSLKLFPITRDDGDATAWAAGLDCVELVTSFEGADALLLMGLPDAGASDEVEQALAHALSEDMPVYCSNPDRASPRAGGATVVSPGEFAHRHKDAGGAVHFYGKPHLPIFERLQAELGLPADRILMVGDSLEHDIAGAKTAGWASLFVEGGLYARHFGSHDQTSDRAADLQELCRLQQRAAPDFSIPIVN